ncbi:MAG: TolC family protein [Bdellovibrio sp.]|nr:TolC family protein [Bdellovibrio sp.]
MKKLFFLMLILDISEVFAQTRAVKNFDEIWQSFYQQSYLVQEARAEKESSSFALARVKRHWLPRVYLSGQILSSDDPGQVFYYNLGQRAIIQSDFVPSTLNNPDREFYQVGIIGVQLPLYEGGSKIAQVSMMESIFHARDLEMEARKSKEYAELSRQYGEILSYSYSMNNLTGLKDELQQVMSSYQVGAKSNPIGNSGLLGLKAVHNRIVGLKTRFLIQIESQKNWISEKAQIDANWVPNLNMDLSTYLEKGLHRETFNPQSNALSANFLEVDASGKMREVEKARFLPRIGLFAQNNLYNGARDFQNSQTFGINLTWDLFNYDSYGRVAEAQAKFSAAEAKVRAAKQDEVIARRNFSISKVMLEENLELLSDTEKLLQEQTRNAMKLFKSGALSALQLSEVINRRVDLIENISNTENKYLEVMSNLYLIHH